MTEAAYAVKLRKAIKEQWPSSVVFKVHGGPYQQAGVADLICCVRGWYVAIELKQQGKHPTFLQDMFLKSIQRAGGIGFIWRTHRAVVECIEVIRSAILSKEEDFT